MDTSIDSAIDALCMAILESALTDKDYSWLCNSALGQAVCNELRIDAAQLCDGHKRYYAERSE